MYSVSRLRALSCLPVNRPSKVFKSADVRAAVDVCEPFERLWILIRLTTTATSPVETRPCFKMAHTEDVCDEASNLLKSCDMFFVLVDDRSPFVGGRKRIYHSTAMIMRRASIDVPLEAIACPGPSCSQQTSKRREPLMTSDDPDDNECHSWIQGDANAETQFAYLHERVSNEFDCRSAWVKVYQLGSLFSLAAALLQTFSCSR